MSLDLTGRPFAEYKPCPYDDTLGLYDFSCKRCVARAYVRGLPREQLETTRRWKATLSAEEIDEMKRLIAEERVRWQT